MSDEVLAFFIFHARNLGNSVNIKTMRLTEIMNWVQNSGILITISVTVRYWQNRKYLNKNKPEMTSLTY